MQGSRNLNRETNIHKKYEWNFNKGGLIENTVEINIYFQGHRERMKIDVIGEQKWSIILEISWLAYYNPEIDWRIGEVKMTRCLEECRKW